MPWSGSCFQPEETCWCNSQFASLYILRPFAYQFHHFSPSPRWNAIYVDPISCLSFFRRFLELYGFASHRASNGVHRESEGTHG